MAINYTEKDNVDPKSKFPVGNLLHFPNFAEGKFLGNHQFSPAHIYSQNKFLSELYLKTHSILR